MICRPLEAAPGSSRKPTARSSRSSRTVVAFVPNGRRVRPERSSRSSRTVVAFVPNCTHQLCLYDWDTASARFSCRCHDAFFGIDGTVISGPPPRPLWRYETRPGGPDTIEIGWVDRA
jgi:Rieske Fe-S protein